MISQAQLRQRREQLTREIEAFCPTTITIGAHADIKASRWSASSSAALQLAGFLPTTDLVVRIRRTLLAGITIKLEHTTFIEEGKQYRFERARDLKDDPCIVYECKAP